jgi:hypothetical protein
METKEKELYLYSNPDIVKKKADFIYGPESNLKISTRKNKKYMIYDYYNNRWVHFGQMDPPMEDFTKHKDNERRMRYLKRAMNIKGNWRNNNFSPNMLSVVLLW